LTVYNKIWKKIEKTQDQESEVEKAWDYLCVKKFPEDDYDDKIKGFKPEWMKQRIGCYLEHRLKLSKKDRYRKEDDMTGEKEVDSLRHRLDMILDASSTSYYDEVREVLPRVAQRAVLATLGEKKYTTEDHEMVFKESLRKLMRMMVFYRLREDKKVAETVLYAAVYDNLKDKHSTMST
jgi:hypothetical protein